MAAMSQTCRKPLLLTALSSRRGGRHSGSQRLRFPGNANASRCDNEEPVKPRDAKKCSTLGGKTKERKRRIKTMATIRMQSAT